MPFFNCFKISFTLSFFFLFFLLFSFFVVGTLVMRMFGQKKTKDGSTLNTMSFDELAVHYPDLPLFMLDKLSLSKDSLHSIHVQPSLFPVLTLLSNLGASEKMDNNNVRLVNLCKVAKNLPYGQTRSSHDISRIRTEKKNCDLKMKIITLLFNS